MPYTGKFTLPDGRKGKITAETREQVEAEVNRLIQQSQGQTQPAQLTQPPQAGPSQPLPPQLPGPPGQVPGGSNSMAGEPYDPAMGPGQSFLTGFAKQGTMNFADEILSGLGREVEAQQFKKNIKIAEKQHPVWSGIGELAGGMATGVPLTLLSAGLGLASGPAKSFIGSMGTGAIESALSTIGANEPENRFENIPQAVGWGAGFGALGHTAANTLYGAGELASNVIPYFRNKQLEVKAFQELGKRFEADGVDPERVRMEKEALGESGIIADLPYLRTQGLAEDVISAKGVPTRDFKTALEQRREERAARAIPLLRGNAVEPAQSIIEQARNAGLTNIDVPGANYQGLRQLSIDLRNKSDENLKSSFIAGIREDELITPVGQNKPYLRKGGPIPTDVYVGNWVDDFFDMNSHGQAVLKEAAQAMINRHGKSARVGQKGLYSLEFLHDVSKRLNHKLKGMANDNPEKIDLQNAVKQFDDILLNQARIKNVEPTVRAGISDNVPVSTAFREPADTPGVPQYQDAIAGKQMADDLDKGLDIGLALASGTSPRDLNATQQMISELSPMQRQAATVSFMDGLLSNIKKMKPNSDINAALRHTQAHREIFSQLSGDPGTTAVAFDQIMDFARREADFEKTARMVNMNPLELEKSWRDRMKSSTARMALMPTMANAITFGLNVMNSIADKRMNPKVAAKVASTLFNKDISEAEWQLIQNGFDKSGSMIRLKRMLANTVAAGAGGSQGSYESGGF